MSVQNFIPELWSTQLLVNFRKTHVFGNLVNRNYEGEIRNFGDTVRITTPSAISVSPYSGTVTYEAPTATQQSLLIDQAKYWAFKLDDVDQAQANVNLMTAYMQEAAYSLADAVDQDLAGLYTDAGLAPITIDIGKASPDSVYEAMVLAGQRLDEANVPRSGRWVAMTPAGYAAVLKEDQFIHSTQAADQVIRTGEVGSISGFTVFVSNNLVNTASDTYAWVYGTNAAITFAEQVVKTEAMRLENSFHDAVRGLLVYGRKVVRPDALGVILADQ